MPRGSKPGERRGGRQRGTPNKKTSLRKAAIDAAAARRLAAPTAKLSESDAKNSKRKEDLNQLRCGGVWKKVVR